MYLRHTTVRKNGKTHSYWRLVRSVRRGRRVVQEPVAQLGELDGQGRARAGALALRITGREEQYELFEAPAGQRSEPVAVPSAFPPRRAGPDRGCDRPSQRAPGLLWPRSGRCGRAPGLLWPRSGRCGRAACGEPRGRRRGVANARRVGRDRAVGVYARIAKFEYVAGDSRRPSRPPRGGGELRVTTAFPATGFVAPTDKEFGSLLKIVEAARPPLRGKVEPGEFARAFYACGHFWRTTMPRRDRYFSYFTELANEMLSELWNAQPVSGDAFFAACLGHGDIAWRAYDPSIGALLEVGLDPIAARRATTVGAGCSTARQPPGAGAARSDCEAGGRRVVQFSGL